MAMSRNSAGRSQTTETRSREPSTSKEGTEEKRREEERRAGAEIMAEVLELTEIQIASMKDMLDGKIRSPGANLAVMGFWKKTKDSQIIGRVTTCVSRPSRFPPHDSNTLLFVQGMIRYPRPVLTEDGEVEIEAGDHQGVWGVQLDAATAAFASDDIVGARIHFNIEGKEKLASGMTRYKYRWARRFDIGVEG